MATAVTVLVGILSAGLLTGRIYELFRLTDFQTGFFIYKGIVFNPLILAIFVVIVICCGVLVFGDNKTELSFFSKSSRPIAIAAGAMLAAYAVLGFMAGQMPVAAAAGAVALLAVGIAGLSVTMSAKNLVTVFCSMVFFIGYCLDIIVVNVSTVYNVEFTKNALCTLAAGMLLMCVMKAIWSPSKFSGMLLYISGLLAFAFCGVMHIADIVHIAATSTIQPQQLVFHAGFAFIGLYGMDNAISVLPPKYSEQPAEETPAAEQVNVQDVQDTIKAQLTAFVESQQKTVVQEQEVTAYVPVPTSEKSAEYTKFFAEMYGTQPAEQPPAIQPKPAAKPAQPVELNIKQLTEEIHVPKAEQQPPATPAAKVQTDPKTTWKAEGTKTVYKKPKN